MKKYLTIIAVLLSMSTIAAPWDIKKRGKVTFADPELIYADAGVHHTDGFRVDYAMSNWAERPMKLVMEVRTYARQGVSNWQWVWLTYTVFIPAYDGNGGGMYFSVNPLWQYQGSYNSNGDLLIDAGQYYVTYFGPI